MFKEFRKKGLIKFPVPSTPNEIYKDKGWKGWGDFLGTGFIDPKHRIYLSYDETKKYLKKLKINTYQKWIDFRRTEQRPRNIPTAPKEIYRKDWKGWSDFLGKI